VQAAAIVATIGASCVQAAAIDDAATNVQSAVCVQAAAINEVATSVQAAADSYSAAAEPFHADGSLDRAASGAATGCAHADELCGE